MPKKILISILFSLAVINIGIISAADWYIGDLHQHTGFSTVGGYSGASNSGCSSEWLDLYGYTIEELKEQTIQAGYDKYWFSITDHSYCLNSSEWDIIKSDSQTYTDSNYLFLPGEELSIKDDSAGDFDEFPLCIIGKAAHLGAHGISNFISEDPPTAWCPNSPSPQGGINSINNDNGLAIINHPFATYWDFESIDYVSNYEGIEVWNAEWDSTDESARLKWKEFLLDGDKIFAYGGSDHHEENFTEYLNPAENHVHLNSLTESNLKTALEEGYSSVSNNGEMYIEVYDSYNETWEHMGETFNVCEDDTVNITVNYDLDYACTLRIYEGVIGSGLEYSWTFNISGSGSKEIQDLITTDVYFRAQCISSNEEYRIYSNPIWVELSPDSDGDGYCTLSDCDDNDGSVYPGATEYCDSKDNDCDSSVDEGCEGAPGEPEGQLTECNETGYDQCFEYTHGDCNAKIAVNYYTNVNNIKWGAISDSSDPYVIKNYTVGWKGIGVLDVYYNVLNPGTDGTKDCIYGGIYEGGCHTGEKVISTGTKAIVTPPRTASSEMILGYDQETNYACWVWFYAFNPNYGASNPIYVLNCYNDSDCSSSYYCDKTGNWFDWSCIPKKSDGQLCTLGSQCQSGYCDNDGVGLADDNWCFTPYNTYFDGQESTYCEYSTGNGDINCDEKQIGNSCGADCKLSINAPTEFVVFHPNESKIFDINSSIKINWTSSVDIDNDFIRYFLQYSNDSGGNWTDITSNYGYENKLNDSATEKTLAFTGNENKTIYIRLPKKAKVSYARFDFLGLAS